MSQRLSFLIQEACPFPKEHALMACLREDVLSQRAEPRVQLFEERLHDLLRIAKLCHLTLHPMVLELVP